jgi:hypothetical protein
MWRRFGDRARPPVRHNRAVNAIPPADEDSDAVVWAARQVLGVPDLTEADDLFDAGMTSMVALRLADRLSGLLGRKVTVADVYDGARLNRIRAIAGPATATPSPAAARRSVTLSHAQQRFWLAEELSPGATDNMLVLGWALTGPLRPDLLDQAFADVLERHPILRTRYRWVADSVVAETLPVGPAIERIDPPTRLTSLPAFADRIAADWWETPMRLDQRPPLRARLCRVDAATHLLCLNIHHIAFDGWSERLFVDDLGACYKARLAGKPADASPTATGSGDRDSDSDSDSDGELSFWREALAGAPPPFLPSPAEPFEEATRVEVVRNIPAATMGRIHATVQQRRIPALAALMAATARALAGVFAVSDLCLGTVIDGRDHSEDESTIGYFVNPLALPLTSVADRKLPDLLDHAAAALLSVLRHTRTPFDELVRLLKPERRRHPWFQTFVILQFEQPGGELAPGTFLRPVRVRPPRMTREFVVQVLPQPDGGWELQLAWRADGCDEAATLAVADKLTATLDDIAELNQRT